MDDRHQLPPCVQELYKEAVPKCQTNRQRGLLKYLLWRFASIFSTGEGDLGRITSSEHTIPVKAGICLIRQPPHWLGPEKETEADHQVRDLVQRGLIVLANGSWASSVALVQKKDGA